MVENKQFRLSPASYLNDPQEGKILFEYIKLKVDNNFINQICKSQLEKNDETNNIVFIRSLTTLEDKLIMWDSSYGDNCQGVSVGIPASSLSRNCGSGLQLIASKDLMKIDGANCMNKINKQKIDNENILLPLSDMGLYKIKYIDPKVEEKNLDEILKLLIEFIEAYFKTSPKNIEIEEFKDLLLKMFLPLSQVIKHKDFEHESEYRLIYIPNKFQENSMQYVQSDLINGNYIQTEGFLFSSKEDEKTKIFLGPKLNHIEKLKIKDSINQKKINAEIIDSSISFR